MTHTRSLSISPWAAVFLAVSLMAALGCKKEAANSKPPVAPDTLPRTDTAPLWKLVPKDAVAALVISEGALEYLHTGAMQFVADFAGAPGGDKVLAEMKTEAAELARMLTTAGPADSGVDLQKGFVLFVTKDDNAVMVLPVADRKKFLTFAEGKKQGQRDQLNGSTCDQIKSHYVCATVATALDSFGKAEGMKAPDGEMQGHIEGMVGGALVSEMPMPMSRVKSMRGSVVLERGGATARLRVEGSVEGIAKTSGPPRLLADVAKLKPTGVLSIQPGAVFSMAMAQADPSMRGVPLPGGLTSGALLDALDGDIAGYALAGSSGGVIRLGLKDEAPFAKLVGQCETLLPPPVGSAQKDGDRCAVTVTPPGSPPLSATIWVKNKSLRIGIGDFEGKRDAPPLTAMAREFLENPWMLGAWGNGGFVSTEWKQLAAIPEVAKELREPQAQMAIWFFLHLAELGFGVRAENDATHTLMRVRTSWSNPDAVRKDLEPLLARAASGDFAALDEVVKLGAKHPNSPLATDLRSGVGAAAPMTIVGMLAAVAIPAFTKYIKKSKTSEAWQFIKKLRDGGRAHYMDGAPSGGLTPAPPSYPKTSSALTPPAGTCCAAPEGKCTPNAQWWANEPWLSLQFSIDDPHYYSYQYTLADDGKSFTVRAVGDLDCDGVYSTFEMQDHLGANGLRPANDGVYRENETE